MVGALSCVEHMGSGKGVGGEEPEKWGEERWLRVGDEGSIPRRRKERDSFSLMMIPHSKYNTFWLHNAGPARPPGHKWKKKKKKKNVEYDFEKEKNYILYSSTKRRRCGSNVNDHYYSSGTDNFFIIEDNKKPRRF
ncbi:hypothetical protein GQR58_019822 [Nymphon striatum]|nr:hypothetical protein GQR58_019822 [Nymphon striatum]